jgi:hypothetical protein
LTCFHVAVLIPFVAVGALHKSNAVLHQPQCLQALSPEVIRRPGSRPRLLIRDL